jgi:Condensation domain
MLKIRSADESSLVDLSYNQMARLALAYGEDRWFQPPTRFTLRVSAPVDAAVLAGALTVLASRHSALRTFFPLHLPSGTGACMRPEDAHWPMRIADGSDVGHEDGAVMRWLREPFVPGDPPLLRAALIRKGQDDWLLELAIDHLNFDGGSMAVFAEDLSLIWRSLAAGIDTAKLSEPAMSYDRFVHWQREWVTRRGQEAMDYWLPRWAKTGLFPAFALPSRGGMSDDNACGRLWESSVSLANVQRSGERLGSGHFSPFMLVATSLFWVIRKRFGTLDLGLHFAFSNRVMHGSRQGIGFYSNRVLLYVSATPHMSFADLAVATRQATTAALRYGSLPFGLISERLFPEERTRRPEREYMFLNMLEAGRTYPIPGGTATVESSFRPDDIYNPGISVNCTVDESAQTILLSCAYGSRFYSDETVDAFMSEVVSQLSEV